MEKVKFYLGKYKLYIILGVITILLASMFIFIIFNREEEIIEEEIVMEKKEEAKVEKIVNIKVDIKGYVEKPGVYELDNNSRVIDVINKAGGLKKNANTDYINLSKKIIDEMIIIIYSNDQVDKFKKEENEIIYIEYKCDCPDNINDACITENDIVNTNNTSKEEKKNIKDETINKEDNIIEGKVEDKDDDNNEDKTLEEKQLVSINTGTKEELMSLPGIGESKAENIIKYREEIGKFKKLEDIMNISGIGEKAYSKIKDYIKL